jgi:hypothetical protein
MGRGSTEKDLNGTRITTKKVDKDQKQEMRLSGLTPKKVLVCGFNPLFSL